MDDVAEVTIVRVGFEIEEELKDLEFCRFHVVEIRDKWARIKLAYRHSKDATKFTEFTVLSDGKISLSFDKPWHWTD